MKNQFSQFGTVLLLGMAVLLSSCAFEDPGPIQPGERVYELSGFSRLEMGSAFNIDVQQGTEFYIKASGDIRNIDDLNVYTSDGTLRINFKPNRINRKHTTIITIIMPVLEGFDFSGASKSKVSGFVGDEVSVKISGASVCELTADYNEVVLDVSGSSRLTISGSGSNLSADVSGASELHAYDYPVSKAKLQFSGASSGRVSVHDELEASASGASSIRYKGNPSVKLDLSGGSSIKRG